MQIAHYDACSGIYAFGVLMGHFWQIIEQLKADCQLVAATSYRQLRSSDNFKRTIIRTTSCLGNQAFAAAGPRLWNGLPTHVRQPDLTSDSFHCKLKTYIFVRGTGA